MLKTSRYLLLLLLVSTSILASVSTRTPALCAARTDMNGIWLANDGGTYYVRQLGNEIWWLGMSRDDGKTWTNVFKGVKDGNTVSGQWADVPKGKINSGGILKLQVQGNNQSVLGFTRSEVTGGFGGSQWSQRCDDQILIPIP